ncbi:MAG TPA: ABC transporter substrate-binding protein [Nitrososphaerales archaeon]|nr:ABC transporter substrate-binding protein [Nitrososphaerales archaeon]HUK75445.1 ABC transporter substrate-binding protein [Nitrososphaerales archaeon]
MSLNPGSVPILACDLGMFESAGVHLKVKECLGSPGATSALLLGEAVFAQLPTLDGLRLVAERKWPGKIFWANKAEKTSSPAGFVMMSAPSIRKMGDLRGRRFGVGAEGDYWAPIVANLLRLNGLKREEVVWVKDLDPLQKAEMLLDGKIDVMLTSVQNYIAKFEGDRRVRVLARGEELAKYREGMPQGPSFVGVASERMLEEEAEEVQSVATVLMKAARLFSEDADSWVEAAFRRRPDVPKGRIRKLWDFFRGDWPVGAGLDLARLGEMLRGLRTEGRRPPIGSLVTTRFERGAMERLGAYPT